MFSKTELQAIVIGLNIIRIGNIVYKLQGINFRSQQLKYKKGNRRTINHFTKVQLTTHLMGLGKTNARGQVVLDFIEAENTVFLLNDYDNNQTKQKCN